VTSIERLGRRALAVRADLTRAAECRRVVETAARKLGRLDILVNNVGDWVVEPLSSMDVATWRRVIDSNLTATFLCPKFVVSYMRRRSWRRIVNSARRVRIALTDPPRCPRFMRRKRESSRSRSPWPVKWVPTGSR